MRAGDWLIASGQIGVLEGSLVEGVEAQTRQALANLEGLLQAEGASLASVVKTTVFLRHMADFGRMNDVYAAAFGDSRPARSTVAVADLPLGALVEVDAWAWTGPPPG